MSNDREFWEARIASIEEAIVATEGAIIALAGGAQSYHLNTGQTTQTVVKAQLSQLQNSLESLLNLRTTLRARLCGGASRNVVPSF